MRRARRLSTQILVSQLAVVLVTTIAGFLLAAYIISGQLDRQYEQRALAVAHSVAALPAVRRDVAAGDPAHRIAPLAAGIRGRTRVTYVVVTDRRGIRFSHPNADLIGKHVSTPPLPTRTGKDWVGIQTGTLGLSARGKTPIFNGNHQVIGEVSVGILEQRVSRQLFGTLPTVAGYMLAALALGTVVAMTLARRLKRRTFGLELHEIASLLREREAMLHGIRDGVVTLNDNDEVTLLNDEARRLLGIRAGALGERLTHLVSAGRLRDVLTGEATTEQTGDDAVVVTNRHCLVINRMPVQMQGRPLGAVITVQDRTQTEGLLRELDSVRGFSGALRAQQHEFANRMHTLAGLLELGEYDEAVTYLTEISGTSAGLADRLREQIASPTLVAMLIAKSTVAAERGVRLVITDESRLHRSPADPGALVTIVGNLIDNAIDAAATGGRHPGEVTLDIDDQPDHGLTLTVRDNGPGLPDVPGSVFDDGFSTKPARAGMRRGLGLALVSRLVRRLGGTITATSDAGAVFTVSLPAHVAATESEVPL